MAGSTTSERNKARRGCIIAQIRTRIATEVMYDSQLFMQAVQIGKWKKFHVQDTKETSAS